MFKIKINKSILKVIEKEPIASGASKVYDVNFEFDESWDELVKTAIFKVAETSVSILAEKNCCEIPFEVLDPKYEGKMLWIGVFGANTEGVKLPTVWHRLGVIQPGAELSESARNPTETVIASIYAKAESAEEKVTAILTKGEEIIENAFASEQAAEEAKAGAEEAAESADLSAHNAILYSSFAERYTVNAEKAAISAEFNAAEAKAVYAETFEGTMVNRLTELTADCYVNKNGEVCEEVYYYHSNKIAVSPGETITYQATYERSGERAICPMYYIAAYASNGEVLPAYGFDETIYSYTVPDGVVYIICTIGFNFIGGYCERAIVASDTVIPYSNYVLKPSAIPYLKNDYSNAIKGTLSGEAVAAKDVSPIEHDLKVKVTAEDAELGGVTVSRCGKNLFDISKITNASSVKNNGDGSLKVSLKAPTSNVNLGITLAEVAPSLTPGQTYTYSAKTTAPVNYIRLSGTNTIWHSGKSLEITSEHLSGNIYVYGAGNITSEDVTFILSDIQIELGEAATAYEPYIEPQSAVSDADGNVSGLVSLSPSMTLMSDTEGVTINCEYNRDATKVIEELTQAIISLGGNI